MDILKELKVMYVEDDDNTRNGIERFLKRRFGKVYTAENAEKGIEIFQKAKPDIAIVDILLPGMGGLEMIKKLRETQTNCKFLITSSVSDAATILEAVDLDIENYIVKPIDTDVFEEKLRKIGSSIAAQKNVNAPARSFYIDRKNEAAEKIRKGFIKIIKENSGRGPRDVVVAINENNIEITAYGVLTTMEKTMMSDIKNMGHVEESHRIFYHAIENDLAEMIGEVAEARVELQNIKVDAKKDRELSKFAVL